MGCRLRAAAGVAGKAPARRYLHREGGYGGDGGGGGGCRGWSLGDGGLGDGSLEAGRRSEWKRVARVRARRRWLKREERRGLWSPRSSRLNTGACQGLEACTCYSPWECRAWQGLAEGLAAVIGRATKPP
ncbi:hypothetical protein QBC39DRAFT_436940 [Podospora conica]|nr:hypothetical protein QBC39DRAFT_436940 [Schizothecium conicum]